MSDRNDPRSWCRVLMLTVVVAVGMVGIGLGDTIVGTKHDLSVSGKSSAKATSETEICLFCHTPHSAGREAPLWNRLSSGAVYTPYSSTTAKSRIGQPTGNSKLCLSCHDGTVALGMVRSRPKKIKLRGGSEKLPEGSSNLETDLQDDHPISFVYDQKLARSNSELVDPDLLPKNIRLENGDLQCTSCHSVHDNRYGKFLVMDNDASELCVQCHRKNYWETSSHRTSDATWNGVARDPWPHTERNSVKANGCENCHRPHTAGTKQRLLIYQTEEDNCLSCHNGKVASKDIESDLKKVSAHDVTATTGIHDPYEDVVNPARHVECVDCHNPHAVLSRQKNPQAASGALAGVKGVDTSGKTVQVIQFEYELCYRCHADSLKKGAAVVKRVQPETNVRLEFDVNNSSFHPVVSRGHSTDVPSLIHPLTVSSQIYCTSCHNSNQGRSAGGSGPDGPHGSTFRPILERRMEFTDSQNESESLYALCYKCHDRRSILGDESFTSHSLHVKDQKTSCTTCHDPHGSPTSQRLINFNAEYVKASASGRLEFNFLGNNKGECYLSCHGYEHNPASYGITVPLKSVTPAKYLRPAKPHKQ